MVSATRKLLYALVIVSMLVNLVPPARSLAMPEVVTAPNVPNVQPPDPKAQVNALLQDPQSLALQQATDGLSLPDGLDELAVGGQPLAFGESLPDGSPTLPQDQIANWNLGPNLPVLPSISHPMQSLLPDLKDSQPQNVTSLDENDAAFNSSADGEAAKNNPITQAETAAEPAMRLETVATISETDAANSSHQATLPAIITPTIYTIYVPFLAESWPLPANTITPEGGEYTSPDGRITLSFPEAAVDEPIVISYTVHMPQPQSYFLPGSFTLSAQTLDGRPLEMLNRPVGMEIAYHPTDDQATPQLRWWDAARHRWVSIGSTSDEVRHHGISTSPTNVGLASIGNSVNQEASTTLSVGVSSLGTYAVTSSDTKEDPDDGDEGQDGFVIECVCWEPGDASNTTEIVSAQLFTSTQDSFLSGGLVLYDDGDIFDFYSQKDVDFALEPTVIVTMEETIPYTVGLVLSYTVFAFDTFSGTLRYDWEEGALQVGTKGCVAGGGCETQAPTIHALDIWQSGNGLTVVDAVVMDNVGVASVELIYDGQPMPMESVGNGIYRAAINLPYADFKKHTFQVKAADACGNYVIFPGVPVEGFSSWSDDWGTFCLKCNGGYRGTAGDPIDSFNGNFTYQTLDASIAGIGGTTLTLNRMFNSSAALWSGGAVMRYTDDGSGNAEESQFAGPPRYFGPGWSFPFGAYLLQVDKAPYFEGIQISYADGHTALFTDSGGGVYRSDSPLNNDTLVLQGGEYLLTHHRTLVVEHFDAVTGKLTAIADRNGNRTTLTYNGKALRRIENASGRWMEFGYNHAGLITSVTLPEGITLGYEYTAGRLTAFVDGEGHRTQYVYNERGQLTQVLTPEGHPSLRVASDAESGRATEQIIGAAEKHIFAYSADGHTTTLTDAYGTPTVHHYDDQTRLIRIDYADGTYEAFDYNDKFNRIFHRDRAGGEWHYTYDERGNRLTEDGPLGSHREWEYNDLNLVTRSVEKIDASHNRVMTFTYDAKGNLTQLCNPYDCSTITYEGRGLPTDVLDFAENPTHNVYNAAGDLVASTNGENETTEFAYDDLGRLAESWTPLDFHSTYTYDKISHLTDLNGPLGYHLGYTYDPNGNLETTADPNGGVTRYAYDASEKVVTVTGPLNYVTAAYTYGLMNELASFTDAEERLWTYEYDDNLRLTDLFGPEDTHTSMAYDAVGNVTDVTNALSRVTHTEYDALYRPTSVTLNFRPGQSDSADVNVDTHYAYNLVGDMLQVTDAEGNSTVFEYDLLSRLTLQRDAEGQETRYAYDAMSNVVTFINPRDFLTTYTYDKANRLSTITDAKDSLTTFVYDDDGNLSDQIDPLGVVTHYDYNALDRPVTEIRNYQPGQPADSQTNVTTSSEYDLAGNVRFVTEPRNFQAEFRYDAAMRLVETFDYEGAHMVMTYDKVNNLLTATDDNGHTTTYSYDDLDRRTSVTNPETDTVTFVYNKVGDLIELVDANQNHTQYEVDALGRVTRMVDALQGKWLYAYNRVGNILVETDANDHATTYTFDKVYRLLSSTDAENHTTSFRWDLNDNLVELIDGNDHHTLYGYDELDRLTSTTNPELEITQYGYDALGNQTELIEADNTITRYNYDPLYRLNSVTENYVQDGPSNDDTNVVTHYTYDASSNLTRFINANSAVTQFEYDGMGRLISEIDPLTNTWTYTYDGVGNRLTRRDANGKLTTYTYYPDDQPHRIDYENGTSVEFTYDPNNNRTVMQDSLGTTTWTYDALNRTTDVLDLFNRVLHTDYDPVSNRTGLTYPDGHVVTYTYYKNNWLKTMLAPEGNLTSYERDGVGNLTHITNPNSTVTDLTYDKADRVLTLTNQQIGGANKTNSAYTYTYNDVGHITQIVNTYGWRQPDTVTETYTYDGLHRLAGMQNTEGVSMSYAYDKVGNRKTWTTNDDLTSQTPLDGFTATYAYNAANQLLSVGVVGDQPIHDMTVTFRYDANGNRINKEWNGPQAPPVQGVDYTYDPENRLTIAQDYQLDPDKRVDRAITTLDYDGDGRRLVQAYDPKTGNGGEKRTEYTFDGLDPVAEYDILNGQRDNFYRGADGRIATMHHFPAGTPGQMFWYDYNFKGDVVGLTKQSGQSIHNYRYDPYGGVVPDTGNFTDPHNHYTLTGKEFDENTGLIYFGARHYDPKMGVWVTQDIYRGMQKMPVSMHRYGYVYGNPVSYYDAYGYWPDFLDKVGEAVSNAASSAGQWIQENQDTIAKVAITGVAIAGTAALCAATAGVGCVIGAAAIGAAASYSNQVVDNAWQDDGSGWKFEQSTFTDVDWRQVVIDGVIAGAGAGIGQGFSKLGSTLLKGCANAACMVGINTLLGMGEGALMQMSSNFFDGDECTGLLDNVGSSALWGGAFSFASSLGSSLGSKLRPQGEGVVYKRVDLNTGEEYVGQSKSWERYTVRQTEHSNANPDALFHFEELGRATPGQELNVLEEDWIRKLGGPQTQGGSLANQRYQMSNSNYQNAGGMIAKPTP